MTYADNEKKFVVVLNRRHPMPRLLNAACHATAGLAADIGSASEMLAYPNEEAGFTATISRYPFIILTAKNTGQMARLREAAAAAGVAHNIFVASMIGATAEAQIDATRSAAAAALDYMTIALFGEAEVLNGLTRKFSLLRESDPNGRSPDVSPD